MRQKNQNFLSFISAAVDVALTYIAYVLAIDLRFDVMNGIVSISMDSPVFRTVALCYALAVVLIYVCCRIYKPLRTKPMGRIAGTILLVNALCVLGLMAVLFTFKLMDVSRGTLILFWVISSFFVIVKLLLIDRYRKSHRNNEKYLRHVIVVGNGKNAANYISDVSKRPDLGIKVEGYVSSSTEPALGKKLGGYEDIGAILEQKYYDGMVLALEPEEISFMPLMLRAADKEGIRVEMIPLFNEYYPTHPSIESIGETKLVDLRATPLDNIALAAVKRAADIIASFILLIVLSPLMLAIAIGVKLSSPGPVIFKQERIGKDKKSFIMYKFRSMRTDIDHSGWSTDEDPRKTKFGSFIRKFSLDELPQFWNVFTGTMSMIGPRPELPVYVRQFKEEIPLYLVRQQVRPGITGWAQVNGLRGDTSIEDRVVYDIWYIQNWSIGLDIKILWKTVFGGMINSEKMV